MTGKLEGKVAIITGGGQGVGRGVALSMVDEGAKVAVVGRTLSKCEAVAKEVDARGGEAIALTCDVTSREDVDATVAATVEQWGRLDSVVNNAQSLVYKSIRRFTEEDMESMWQSGPMGTFRMSQAAFPHLRESKGAMVNMGSGSSIMPHGTMSGYAMAKEAIRVFTRVAAVEWGPYGIRVNAVCPLAKTPGQDQFEAVNPNAYEEMVIPQIPLRRLGEPEPDVGPIVAFLCSDEASYLTGSTLMADGGFNYLR